jgi:hypothetical protein
MLKLVPILYILACHLQIEADPDPACHFGADGDPDPFTLMRIHPDPDPQHCLNGLDSLSGTSKKVVGFVCLFSFTGVSVGTHI